MEASSQPVLTQATDEQLVAQYRQGNQAAFEALVARYQTELYHFLFRLTGNRAAADDIFQEAFLQVHVSIDTFDVERRFKPWLFTIAANKARDMLRRNNRRPESPLLAAMDSGGGSASGSGASGSGGDQRMYVDLMSDPMPLPTEQAQQNEIQELVREAVGSLPEHLREILILAYFQKMPYQDIAQMLQIPLGTVKSRLHAAVGTFAQAWKLRNENDVDET